MYSVSLDCESIKNYHQYLGVVFYSLAVLVVI